MIKENFLKEENCEFQLFFPVHVTRAMPGQRLKTCLPSLRVNGGDYCRGRSWRYSFTAFCISFLTSGSISPVKLVLVEFFFSRRYCSVRSRSCGKSSNIDFKISQRISAESSVLFRTIHHF